MEVGGRVTGFSTGFAGGWERAEADGVAFTDLRLMALRGLGAGTAALPLDSKVVAAFSMVAAAGAGNSTFLTELACFMVPVDTALDG